MAGIVRPARKGEGRGDNVGENTLMYKFPPVHAEDLTGFLVLGLEVRRGGGRVAPEGSGRFACPLGGDHFLLFWIAEKQRCCEVETIVR